MKTLVLIAFLALYMYSVKAFTVFEDSDDEDILEKRLVDKMESLEKLAERFVKRNEKRALEEEKEKEKRDESSSSEEEEKEIKKRGE